MKSYTVTLTEDQWSRVVFALGCFVGQSMRESQNPSDKEASVKVFQENGAIVQKISEAKYAQEK